MAAAHAHDDADDADDEHDDGAGGGAEEHGLIQTEHRAQTGVCGRTGTHGSGWATVRAGRVMVQMVGRKGHVTSGYRQGGR